VGIGTVEAARKFADDLDITNDPDSRIILACDDEGTVAKSLGCYQGWLATDAAHIEKYPQGDINPYLKLFGMIFGFGSPGTMKQVTTGYVGDASSGRRGREWVVNSLLQGASKGRSPKLTMDDFHGVSPDSSLRPFELATLRLQNGKHIVNNWNILKPPSDRLFTQMGGTFVMDFQECIYESFDLGILNYANMDEVSLVAEAAVNGQRWYPPLNKSLLKKEMKDMEAARADRLEQARRDMEQKEEEAMTRKEPEITTIDNEAHVEEMPPLILDEEEVTRRDMEEKNEKLEFFNEEEVERRAAEEEAEKVSLFDDEEMERRKAEEEAERISLFDEESAKRRQLEEEAEKVKVSSEEEVEPQEAEEDTVKVEVFNQDNIDRVDEEELERRAAEEEAEKVALFDKEEIERRNAEEEAEKIRLFDEEEVTRRELEEEAEKLEIFDSEEVERRKAEEEAEKVKVFNQDEIDRAEYNEKKMFFMVEKLANDEEEKEMIQESVQTAKENTFTKLQNRFFRSELKGLQAEEDEFLKIQEEANEALRFAEEALQKATDETSKQSVGKENRKVEEESVTDKAPQSIEEIDFQLKATRELIQRLKGVDASGLVESSAFVSLRSSQPQAEAEKRAKRIAAAEDEARRLIESRRNLMEAQAESESSDTIQANKSSIDAPVSDIEERMERLHVQTQPDEAFQRRLLQEQMKVAAAAAAAASPASPSQPPVQEEQKQLHVQTQPDEAFQRRLLQEQMKVAAAAAAAASPASPSQPVVQEEQKQLHAQTQPDDAFQRRLLQEQIKVAAASSASPSQPTVQEEQKQPEPAKVEPTKTSPPPPPPPAYTTRSAPLMGVPRTDSIANRNLLERRRRAFAQSTVENK
jgi:hypothetical protein